MRGSVVSVALPVALTLCVTLCSCSTRHGREGSGAPDDSIAERASLGRVVGATREHGSDRPIAGLAVTLERGDAMLRTTSGADGAFAFDDVPASGPWTLAVAPDDLHDGATVRDVLVTGRGRADVGAIVLALASGVGGVVTEEDGRAAEGATVDATRFSTGLACFSLRRHAEPGAPPPVVASARAGAGGRFRLSGLAPGLYELTARRGASALAVAPEVVVFDRATPPLRLVLQELHRVEGRVVRADGGPVEALEVVAVPYEGILESSAGSTLHFPVRTGAGGAFTIDGVPAGNWSLSVRGDGWSAGDRYAQSIPARDPVEVRFNGRARLGGRVRGPDGRPVAGAALVLYQSDSMRVATSRADGAYEFPALGEGAETIFAVTADGFAPWPDRITFDDRSAPNLIKIAAGANVRDIDLSRGAAVRGVVVAGDGGGPQAGVRVQALSLHYLAGWSPSATTDAQGRFEIRGLPACPVLLLATKSGWVERGVQQAFKALDRAKAGTPDGTIVLAADGAVVDVRLELDPAPVVRGRVVAPDGSVVPYATVRVRLGDRPRDGTEYLVGPTSGSAGPDGRFGVALPLETDDVEIVASAPGFHDGTSTGAAAHDLDVRLRRGATIEGRVVSKDGGALAGADVSICLSQAGRRKGSPEDPFTARSDADGRFRFDDLDPEEWTVRVRHPRALEGSCFVNAPEGGVGRADLLLAPALVVSGRVLLPDETPAVGATVWFATQGESRFGKHVGPDGRFRAESIARGSWEIRAVESGYAPAAERTVDSDAEDLVLRLREPFTISGVVFWKGAGPLTGAAVLAAPFRRTDGKLVTNLGGDGSFRLEDLARGPHDLSLWWSPTFGNHRSVRLARPVTVEGGSEGVSIEALPGFTLAGRVVHDDGVPVRSGDVDAVRVAVREPSDLLPGEEALVRTRAAAAIVDGKFECEALAPGTYRVTVRSSDGLGRTLSAKADDRGLVIRLCPGLTVRGRILDRNGAPAAGARVYVETEGVSGEESATSDASGAFAVENVTCGTVRLFADRQGGTKGNDPRAVGPVVDVRHGEEAAPVEFRLASQMPTDPRPPR